MYYYIFGAVILILIIWTVGSYAVVWSVEQPAYTVKENKTGYEIRMYPAYIIAKTTVSGSFEEGTSEGFRIIADYIFGNNTRKESIAMTSPVLESQSGASAQKIAMTTPVLDTESSSGTRTIAFIVPSAYTLKNLPTPNNPAVILEAVPARTVAALSFTWYPTASRVEAKKSLLKSYLARDGTIAIGDAETARYNPPLSMPLMLRNEILIPIK